jgi:Ulp1 family protease
VTPETVLVLAVHKVNHWLFVKASRAGLAIYDSMPMGSLQNYFSFPLIAKIAKFSQRYYSSTEVERVLDFPRQNNTFDCGVMMLCGIKDVVRDYRSWSFSQSDIPYKRLLITHELLHKKISGF